MSARDDLLDEYGRAESAPLGTLAELQGKLDAYRAEVIAEYRAQFTMAEARDIARNHRVAVLRETDERLASMKLPEHLKGTLNAGSYADAWRHCRSVVQGMADESEAGEKSSREADAAPALTVYRAEHPDSGITLGHYSTPAAARAHCEATERRSWPTGTNLAFDWIEDDEDRVAELVVTAGQNEESTTGYIVTALEVPSEYDEEADE
jgi:hypothetical protein